MRISDWSSDVCSSDLIRSDLSAAESQRAEADGLLADYRAQLSDAKNESARIIEEARQSADALKRDQEGSLPSALAAPRPKAPDDLEAAKAQAIADRRRTAADPPTGPAQAAVSRTPHTTPNAT